MWYKGKEINGYPGEIFEIALSFQENKALKTPGTISPERAIERWDSSKGHQSVIANKGNFKDMEWKAVGVGITKGYTCIWFGVEPDPIKEIPKVCKP
jgi:hypothetical protein